MALLYEGHNVGVVGVGGVNRHEAAYAVDVAAYAGRGAVEGHILSVCVHGSKLRAGGVMPKY